MKSTFFTKALDETVLELNVPVQETIQKLRAQEGICSETDSMQHTVSFRCNKNGKFRVSNWHILRRLRQTQFLRVYYLNGQVVAEDGKTKIKIYSVYNRLTMLLRYLVLAFGLLVLLAYVLICRKAFPDMLGHVQVVGPFLLLLLMFAIEAAYVGWSTWKEKRNRAADFEQMKDEVAKRVEAVRRWDE